VGGPEQSALDQPRPGADPVPARPQAPRRGIRSTISIPLTHDRTLGVFNFDSTVPGRYSERDLALLLPVAKHIAIALENAILFEEISREKKEWERTFDAITDLVWIEDARRRVVRANRTLLQQTGLAGAEIAGRSCSELLERLGLADTRCLCDETRANRRPSSREFTSAAGGIFQFWAYPLIDEEGRLYAIVHYLKDVTGQKRMEQQLIRSDRLASLGTLVAGIAHEINNPLGIIAGYAEALLDRAGDPRWRGSARSRTSPSTCGRSTTRSSAARGSCRACWSSRAPPAARSARSTSTS